MAQAYAQFRGVMTVELGTGSQQAFAQFTNQAQRAGAAGAASMNRFTRSVDGLEGRLRAAGAGLGAFQGYGGRLASQFNAAANAIALTGARVGGLIAAFAGGATLIGATNDIQNYTARLKAATDSQAEFNAAYASLVRVSGATRSDLGETINFYTRLKLATTQLGLSQQQLASIVTTVQQSIRLSGAGAQEANAALIQFVQGISSANGLSGDEFKSLGENATQVLRNIARGLKELNTFPGFDGTISALRKLGSEGKLTADVVVPALAAVSAQVEADFARLPPTIDQASTAIRNAFLDAIVQGERATGVLSGTARVMLALAGNMDKLGVAAALVAGVLVARMVPALASVAGTAAAASASYALLAASALRTSGVLGASAAGAAALARGLSAIITPVRILQVGIVALSGVLAFNALKKGELADISARLGTTEDELADRVRKVAGALDGQAGAADRAAKKVAALAQIEAQKTLADAKSAERRARDAAAGPFGIRRLQSGLPNAEARQLQELINSGASFEQVFSRVQSLRQRFSAFDRNIQKEPGLIGGLLGDQRYIDTLLEFGKANFAVRDAQQQLADLSKVAATGIAGAGGGAAGGPAQTLKEVQAAAKSAATEAETLAGAAARYREAKIALDRTFGISGQKEFAKLSADQQKSYADQLTAIERNYQSEVQGIKAATAARRTAATEQRKNERLEIQAINAIVRSLPDAQEALQEQIDLANKQALTVTRIRQEDFARVAILDLQLQGQEATAEAFSRLLALKQQGTRVDADTVEYVAQQVEAEAARNVQLERRQALLNIQTRALGQIQQQFTNLFAGDVRGFLPGIAQAFRQQFAQRLSFQIFGDVEREAQLENTGALRTNTTTLERLIGALEAMETRLIGQQRDETGIGPSLGAAANDNRPGSPVQSLDRSARALGDVSRLFRDAATREFIGSDRLGAFGARAGGRFGLSIGETLDRVFGSQSRDANGNANGTFARALGRGGTAIGAALEGSAAADSVVAVLDEIGLFDSQSRSSRTGRRIGGIGGAIAGFAIGGPIGAAVGAFVGNIIGSTIGAAFKRNPFGDVALTATSTGAAGSVFNSRGAGSGEQALTLATAVNDSLGRLAQTLGVGVRAGTGLGAIGFSGDQFFFNPTGGDFKAAGNQRFGTAEEAVAAAIRNAVQVGAFEGLREGSKRLLLAGADLNAQAQKAAEFESVFTELRRTLDPAGAAVEELNRRFSRLRGIFQEAGASAEEYGKLQQLYDLQRAEAIARANDTLKDFLFELTTSSSSGLSIRERQRNAQQAFAGFQADIEAGRGIDQGRFRDAAQTLLDVNRELFGSQGGYFDSLNLVTDLTRRAISNTGSSQSLPEALQLANTPVVQGLGSVQQAIVNGFADLSGVLGSMINATRNVANDWYGGGGGGEAFGGGLQRF